MANLKKKLTDRGIIIIKVPDDSFKFCYPDSEDLLHKIFNLYESQIMVNQNITKNTDRYIGKKVYSYLNNNKFKNIKLFYSVSDTIGKTLEQKIQMFDSSIAYRSADNKNNIPDKIKNEMNNLLDKLRNQFKKEEFYYTMTALYYIANK